MSDAFWTGFFAVAIAVVNVVGVIYGVRKIGRVEKLTGDTKNDVARAVELNQANGVKLNRVETGLAENTAVTQDVAKAVNGGAGRACGFADASQTISSRLNAFQLAMVDQISELKAKVETQTTEIIELKKRLAEKG